MSSTLNRREFMQVGALGASGTLFSHQPKPRIDTRVAPSDNLTIGMISCGARAHQLIEVIKSLPGTEIAAVCDAYSGRVQRAVSRTAGRAKACKDYREIISRNDIDVVVISSPDHWHVEQAVAAMDAGKHCFIEKPMTWSVDEGLRIVEAQRRNGVKVQVGSPGCSSPLAGLAREMVASGKLGQVTLVRAYNNRNSASGAWIYPIPPDASTETVNWDMFLGSAPDKPFNLEHFFRWRCYKDYSGGMSTDLFVHLCTTINYVMSTTVAERVMAMGGLYRWTDSRDVSDTINASLAYPEGFMVNLSGTANNQGGGGPGLQILGTEGTLTMGRQLTFEPENTHNGNGWIVDSWPEHLAKAYYEDPRVRADELPQLAKAHVLSQKGEVYSAEGVDATTVHMEEFFEAVRSNGETREDALVGHYAASCAHMINMSIDSGKEIRWDTGRNSVASL